MDLREKLTLDEIKAGIDAVLPEVRACRRKHRVEPGTVVRVHFSIEGATGRVTQARPLPPHASTPVGICVAKAVKTAVFPRFSSGSMGAVYPFLM